MKIGILIDRLNVGGVEKIAIEETKALKRLGHDASLVVMREKAVVSDAFPDLLEDVPIDYLDQNLHPFLKLSIKIPFFHFLSSFHFTYPIFLPFVINKNRYDYLIVHGTYTTLTAIALKKRRQIPFSTFIWDPSSYIIRRVYSEKFPRVLSNVLYSMAVKFDRHIIKNMNSVLVGGSAHDAFIKDQDKGALIHKIYPSVHPAKKLSSKDSYILMVTAWKEGKNPEYLIELSKAIPSIKIKMAGKWIDPEYLKRFVSLVEKSGCEKNIEILGGVTEMELTNLYSKALVLLQTNDDRGFGMPAMEAAAQGTTFIIPEGQGVGELFKNKVDGFYTKELDTESILSYITLLDQDRPKAASMGKSAWTKVNDNYSWDAHAEQLVQVARQDGLR